MDGYLHHNNPPTHWEDARLSLKTFTQQVPNQHQHHHPARGLESVHRDFHRRLRIPERVSRNGEKATIRPSTLFKDVKTRHART